MSFVAQQSLGADGATTDKINASDSYAGEITVHIHGTFNLTITVYGMVDPEIADGSRAAIDAVNQAGGAAASTITVAGIYRIAAAGLHVQLEVTTYVSGTALIDLVPSVG